MEWYLVFYWTAKKGSLSRAAEELFITQPAVSHAIKQLEEKLGGRLFFRTPRGVKLTAEGEALFRSVEQAYHFLEMGEKRIGEMHQLLSGEIKIGAGDTLCRHVLLPHLADFHREYPAVKIQVTNRTSPETIQLLKEGKIDFGLVNLPIGKDRQLVVRESLPLQDTFVAGGGGAYAKLGDRELPLVELDRLPLISLEKGSSMRAYLDAFMEENGFSCRPEIELGSIDLLVQFALSGLGVAFVIRNFVKDELERGELVELRLEKPIPPRHFGIVHLRDVPLSAAAQHMISLLPVSADR